MKILFLLFAYFLILTVHAQREFSQYTCVVSYKEESTPFYLSMGKKKNMNIGGAQISAALQRKMNMVEISLGRTLKEINNSSSKVETRIFPMNSRKLLVELRHMVGTEEDHFMLECSPRDP